VEVCNHLDMHVPGAGIKPIQLKEIQPQTALNERKSLFQYTFWVISGSRWRNKDINLGRIAAQAAFLLKETQLRSQA